MDYDRLREDVGSRQRPGKDSFPTQVKAVKAWIEALPLANAGATARLLYNGLKEFNQLDVDPLQRLEILELLRTPLGFVIGGMDKHIVGQPLPLPQQKKQIGTVMRDFQLEMARGYRLCVVDLCAPRGAIPFLRGRYVSQAVVRHLQYVGQWLLKAYLCYTDAPAGAWAEAHRMMAFAYSQSIHEKFVTDPQLPGASLSPQSVYVQMALLFITNPYRLTQREIYAVDAACRVWSAYCDLHYDARGSGVFLVDLDGDAPPGVRAGADAERQWRLDTGPLVRFVRSQLATGVGRDGLLVPKSRLGQAEGLAPELLERLLIAWGFSGERAHQRLPAGHYLDGALGLQAAHYLLAQGRDFNVFVNALSGGGVRLTERERSAAWSQASAENGRPSVTPVKVIDQSVGGYRLCFEKAENLRARVGELVALSPPLVEGEEEDSERDYMIGFLRWLRGGPGDTLEAGVQLLSRRAEAVAVRVFTDPARSDVIHRGLLLEPLNPDDSSGPTLLVPSLLDETAPCELLRMPDEFGLEERQVVTQIGAMKLLENTGSYKQFAFGPAESGDELQAPEQPLKPAQLDAIWSTV
jgi:hypothetical protein